MTKVESQKFTPTMDLPPETAPPTIKPTAPKAPTTPPAAAPKAPPVELYGKKMCILHENGKEE